MALILAFVFLTLTTPIDSPCFAQEVTEMGWEEIPEVVKAPEAVGGKGAGGYKAIAAAIAIGLAALGTGYAQGRIGAAGAGAIAEKPSLLPSILILLVIPETIIILGFVIAIMVLMR